MCVYAQDEAWKLVVTYEAQLEESKEESKQQVVDIIFPSACPDF